MENRKHKKGDKLNELQVCKNVKSPNHEHVNQYIIIRTIILIVYNSIRFYSSLSLFQMSYHRKQLNFCFHDLITSF